MIHDVYVMTGYGHVMVASGSTLHTFFCLDKMVMNKITLFAFPTVLSRHGAQRLEDAFWRSAEVQLERV